MRAFLMMISYAALQATARSTSNSLNSSPELVQPIVLSRSAEISEYPQHEIQERNAEFAPSEYRRRVAAKREAARHRTQDAHFTTTNAITATPTPGLDTAEKGFVPPHIVVVPHPEPYEPAPASSYGRHGGGGGDGGSGASCLAIGRPIAYAALAVVAIAVFV